MSSFEYCSTSVKGQGCDAASWDEQIDGCRCVGECSSEQHCSCLLGAENNYSSEGVLLEKSSGAPLLECHDGCECAFKENSCRNRVVQLGVTRKLRVRRNHDTKGSGVWAAEPIASGRFVCEYAGEIIGAEEVERRARKQVTGQGIPDADHNYTLTVKEYSEDGARTTYIDPRLRGNLARFINHSCDPNLSIAIVRVGRLVPIVALFAARDISANEELCYDYGPSGIVADASSTSAKKCLCMTANCRGFLPMSATASE